MNLLSAYKVGILTENSTRNFIPYCFTITSYYTELLLNNIFTRDKEN